MCKLIVVLPIVFDEMHTNTIEDRNAFSFCCEMNFIYSMP